MRFHKDKPGWNLRIDLHDDNAATVQVALTGKNPTMKLLERGHGISVGQLHDYVKNGIINMIHTRSEHMAADIYTKLFVDPMLWNRLRMLINVYSPLEILRFDLNPDNSYLPVKDSVITLSGGKVVEPTGDESADSCDGGRVPQPRFPDDVTAPFNTQFVC